MTLKKYVDIFQAKYSGEEGERYLSFYEEVTKLLAQIKSALANRSQRDCTKIYFIAHYGVDPWGPGAYYEPKLFGAWKISFVDDACILGINCGLGSNSLKVKEIMREQGAENVCLVNCVQDERYLQDLKGVSDEAYVFKLLTDIVAMTRRKWYDYIVVDGLVEGY